MNILQIKSSEIMNQIESRYEGGRKEEGGRRKKGRERGVKKINEEGGKGKRCKEDK